MRDPLDDLAALARALERRVVVYRTVLERQPDDTWCEVETLYRGWFVAAPPDEKGEPDVQR